ncbi:MAG: VTT domain-containing protein [Acidobacteriia bacterium]|nr:VTT domain-containing protein [Terriglobia bacterium]
MIAFGPWGIFFLGVIDSVGVPLPAAMDGLLILVAVKSPNRAYFTALMAVLGSTAGNVALFLAARYGMRRFIKGDPPPGTRQKFQSWFQRYGLLTVFVPAVVPVIPIPLKVFVISAGALHTSLGRFLAVIVVARIIRYFGEAYLGIQLGADAENFLRRNAWTLVGIALALTLAMYWLIRLSDRRRRPAM